MAGSMRQRGEEWLEHARLSLSPRTVYVHEGYIRIMIFPVLGDVPVAELTPVGLDRFYRHLLDVGGPRGPYAPATVKRVHGIVRRALAQGVRWGWAPAQPGPRRLAAEGAAPADAPAGA